VISPSSSWYVWSGSSGSGRLTCTSSPISYLIRESPCVLFFSGGYFEVAACEDDAGY